MHIYTPLNAGDTVDITISAKGNDYTDSTETIIELHKLVVP